MIDIIKKEDCVGCNACMQKCPKQCISMLEDEQGFMYPKVDIEKCINCHLCEKVCPVIIQAQPETPDHVYAAKNCDVEIQRTSSSGGIFFALAEYVIKNNGGVVFGARFNDDWEVVHDYTETIEGVRAFQGSKYVQSRIGDTFRQTEKFLKEGRTVLFSGTPCQIAGLRLYLRKEYGEQLILVDFVCHGVPSPKIWKEYLRKLTHPKEATVDRNTDSYVSECDDSTVITYISFRDKRISWKKYGFAVYAVIHKGDKNSDVKSIYANDREDELLFEPHYKNLYMQGFLRDLYLRPSCYSCPAKCGKSHSDITLGDFWHIQETYPEYFKNGMYSLLLVNSEYGESLLNKIGINKGEVTYDAVVNGNPAIKKSASRPKLYDAFWGEYKLHGLKAISDTVGKMRPSIVRRIIRRANSILKKITGS